MFVRKSTKSSTSYTSNVSKPPWKQASKKIEVVVVEEVRKGARGKKRERDGIPPLFTISAE